VQPFIAPGRTLAVLGSTFNLDSQVKDQGKLWAYANFKKNRGWLAELHKPGEFTDVTAVSMGLRFRWREKSVSCHGPHAMDSVDTTKIFYQRAKRAIRGCHDTHKYLAWII
jgi:hypothetical protein